MSLCVSIGAQKEGAAGFFKGMGKGLVGALTRPTGGIIDMASSTFQGIKRCVNTFPYLRVFSDYLFVKRHFSHLNSELQSCLRTWRVYAHRASFTRMESFGRIRRERE